MTRSWPKAMMSACGTTTNLGACHGRELRLQRRHQRRFGYL